MPCVVGEATQFRSEAGRFAEPYAGDAVAMLKNLERVGIRQIAERLASGRADRQTAIARLVGRPDDCRRIFRDREAAFRPHKDKAFAMLRNAKIGSIEHLPWQADLVAFRTKSFHQVVEEAPMTPDRQTLHILEDEILGVKFGNETDEFQHEPISRIVERSMADHREALARRPAEDDIYALTLLQLRRCSHLIGGKSDHAPRNDGAAREIELVHRTMNGIDFDGCTDIEAGLLKSQAHPACAGEQVDSNRPPHLSPTFPLRFASFRCRRP